MADEQITPVAPAAPLTPAPQASAPAVSSPVSEASGVASESKIDPVQVTVLGAEDAPVQPEVKPSEPVPEVKPETAPEIKPEISPEVKPEAKPAEGEKPSEVKAEEKPAELPKFDWKLPEGVTADQERIGEFNKELGEFLVTNKLDSKLGQEFGQKLLNRHISEIQSVAEKVAQAYNKVWTDQTKKWYDDFVKDPEIGGNRRDTTTDAAKQFMRSHGGTQEQQESLKNVLRVTGLGNHPDLIRLLANANIKKGEPKPLKAEAPPAQKMTLKQKMYGDKKKA